MLAVSSVAASDVQTARLAVDGNVMISRVEKDEGKLATGVGGNKRARGGGEDERGEGGERPAGCEGGMQANAGVFKGDSP